MNEPEVTPAAPRISIVLVCCGQLEYTRLSLFSVLQHSRRAAEVIVVDMASLDGTWEFLQGIAIAAQQEIRVFQVGDDVTYARAYAHGASRAVGEFIVLLSNDAIVSGGWLEHMSALAAFEPTLGIVGAMSNGAPSPQHVADVSYELKPQAIHNAVDAVYPDEVRDSLLELEAFGKRWREEHRSQWFELETLATFCFLIKRSVFEKIGGTFPESALGIAEVELGRAVRAAGFRIACCKDLFIHHSATRTPTRRE